VILYSLKVYRPKIYWRLPANFKSVLSYSLWILMSGMAASFILDIDKSMLSNLVAMENVAYYSVALFIATVVEAPGRAMFQIVSPLVAKALNADDLKTLEQLLKKTSRNLLVVCGLLFLLINLNLDDFYTLVDKPGYRSAIAVVIIVSLGKFFSMSMGCLNNIIGNSKHYRYIMFFSILAALLAVVLNLYWIPRFGLLGAAYATLLVIVLTNVLKIALIYYHYNIHPYEWGTLKIVALVGVLYLLADVVHIDLPPVWSILVRSLGIGLLFIGIAYLWGFMEDIKKAAKNYLAR
jgi:O-antigen/teichoic acid export membrane protein